MQLHLIVVSILLGILYLFFKPIKNYFLVLLDFVELKGLGSKPIPLLLQLDHLLVRLGLEVLSICLVLQVLHILHYAFHFTAESNEEFILVSCDHLVDSFL